MDVNIPEQGDYLINLDLGKENFKTLPRKNMQKGVHRITLNNIRDLSEKEIKVIKQ